MFSARTQDRGTQLLGVILTVLLAISMIPTAGIQPAFADESVERPATTGGDAALEGYAAETAPVAQQREDGMYVAGGLAYTVTDGGLMLVGFDGLPQGEDALKEIVVPETVSVDGKDTPVVSVAIAEGAIAESVVSLTLPQSINNVDTATLAAAFPNLASIEVAAPKASSAPVAAGAAAMKAAYSSFGGILYKNVRAASESDASQTALTKQLVWAPPATVVARIPAECTSIASGAFADVKDLKTVVCFGAIEDIAQAQKADDGTVIPGAFTDEQIATVNVIVPQTGTVVSDSDRVSADVAVTDHSTMDVKREAWWKSGFASDRITLGEVCGSTTNTLPVTEEGVLETAEAEVAYAPETTQNSSSRKAGIEPPESAIPTPVPDDDELDSSESGLVFTHLADMTLSVSWKGDPTATPKHIEIPAYATINGVAYPVTEIAPNAFEGAVFLTSIAIPEGVTTIGESAFAGCANLADATFPSTLRTVAATAFDGTGIGTASLAAPTSAFAADSAAAEISGKSVASESDAVSSGVDTVKSVQDDQNDFIDSYIVTPGATTYFLSLVGVDGKQINFFGTGKSRHIFDLSESATLTYVIWTGGALGCGRTVSNTHERNDMGVAIPDGYEFLGLRWFSTSKDLGPTGSANCTHYFEGGGILFVTAYFGPDGTASNAIDARITSGLLDLGLTGEISTHSHPASSITSGAFDGSRIANNAITSAKINNYTIVAEDLAGSSVTNDKLATSAVTESKIGTNAITSAKIKDLAVSTTKLANGAVTVDKLANNSVTDDKLAVKFGTISYSGLDGADSSVYPTTYRQGGTPALPAPRRDGFEFAGWTWAGQDSPTTSASDLARAFSGSGAVALTANWKESTKGQNCFFADGALDSTASGAWTSTIAVRLTTEASKTSVSGLSFAANDLTGLLKRAADGSLPDVAFAVGSTKDSVSGSYGFGGSPTGTVQLADVDGGKGIYVKITIPAGGIDENRVVGSTTADDYVASIARMTYASIA